MAKIIRREATKYEGGVEHTLDGLADFAVFGGIIGGSAFFVVFLLSGSGSAPSPASWLVFAVAVALFFIGLLSRGVLRALADVVRLQKKAAGLPFSGKVSDVKGRPFQALTCSECGAQLAAALPKCPICKSTFEA